MKQDTSLIIPNIIFITADPISPKGEPNTIFHHSGIFHKSLEKFDSQVVLLRFLVGEAEEEGEVRLFFDVLDVGAVLATKEEIFEGGFGLFQELDRRDRRGVTVARGERGSNRTVRQGWRFNFYLFLVNASCFSALWRCTQIYCFIDILTHLPF